MNISEGWVHEHWEMLTGGLVVLFFTARYYLKLFFSRFSTKENLAACYDKVGEEIAELRKESIQTRKDNSSEHLSIMKTIIEHKKNE